MNRDTAFARAVHAGWQESGLTQKEYAARLGVSQQTLWKWTTGRAYPRLPMMLRVARTLNVDPSTFLQDVA
ncbi:helix-turn-helix domain-containing protein [Amycolatopsis sp. Poz14]|uniref:helix-turn-helix domain-containing protein n=1 Tax=Amycolatopsis sp. Poz14 TaxID=1447705 RepID=UPI001F84E541|nr:helix-turn-helix transcriptional regulator [Amycolatopsis sp. Poz14]